MMGNILLFTAEDSSILPILSFPGVGNVQEIGVAMSPDKKDRFFVFLIFIR